MQAAYKNRATGYRISSNAAELALRDDLIFFDTAEDLATQISEIEGIPLNLINVRRTDVQIGHKINAQDKDRVLNVKGKDTETIIREFLALGKDEMRVEGFNHKEFQTAGYRDRYRVLNEETGIYAQCNYGNWTLIKNKKKLKRILSRDRKRQEKRINGLITNSRLREIFNHLAWAIQSHIIAGTVGICTRITLQSITKRLTIEAVIQLFRVLDILDKKKTWRDKEWEAHMKHIKPALKNFPNEELRKLFQREVRAMARKN